MADNEKIHCSYKKLIDPNSLITNPRNPNQHPDSQIELLAKIIKYQGWRRPITVSNRSGFIIKGHGAREAALRLGHKLVPVDYQDYNSEADEWADMIADNEIARMAQNDEIILEDLRKELESLNFDLELAGFDVDFNMGDDGKNGMFGGDNLPDIDREELAVTQMGDIWLLGNHKLLCGDSRFIKNIELLMGDNKADMIFTDPPYGVSYGDKNKFLNTICRGNCIQEQIIGDHQSITDMFNLWKIVFTLTAQFSTNVSSFYICSPQGGDLMMMMMQAINQSPWALKHTIIWSKNNHVLGRCDYNYKHEPILFGWKKEGTHKFYGKGQMLTSVWGVDKPLKSDLHPTMKPIALIENAIMNSSKKERNCC